MKFHLLKNVSLRHISVVDHEVTDECEKVNPYPFNQLMDVAINRLPGIAKILSSEFSQSDVALDLVF